MITSALNKFCVLLVIFGASRAAHATTTDLGTLSLGTPTAFSEAVIPPTGSFTDIFTFTLPVNDGSGYSVSNFPLSIPGVGSFNTVLTALRLVANPDGIVTTGDDRVVATALSATGASALNLTFGPTPGGPMYLTVSGSAGGTLGGLYSGAIDVAPLLVSVPEPGTWVQLLGGLGLMGFARRWRRP